MIGQRDPALAPRRPIHDYGCYLCALAYRSRCRSGRVIGAAEMIDLYDKAVRERWMDADCYVRKPAAILDHLGTPVEWVGRGDPDDPRAGKEDFGAIQRYVLQRGNGKWWIHFVADPGYDAWGDSLTRRDGALESIRLWRWR